MSDRDPDGPDLEGHLTPGRPGLPKFSALPRPKLPGRPKLPSMPTWAGGPNRRLLIGAAAAGVLLVLVVVLLATRGPGGLGGADDPEDRVVEYLEAYEDADCERMVDLNPGWLGDGTLEGCEQAVKHSRLADYEMGTVILKDDGTAVVRAKVTQTVGGDDLQLTATFYLEETDGEWDFEEPEFG